MEFRNFLERNDLPLIQRIYADTQQSLAALIEHYRKFYEVHFPNKKRAESDHEYIMKIFHEAPKQWKSNFPKIYDYTMDIRAHFSGHWSAGSKLNGEIVGEYIVLYDDDIGQIVEDLKELAYYFGLHRKDGRLRQAADMKKDAKEIHAKLILELEKKKDSLSKSLYHEIIHAARHGHIKDPQIPLHLATQQRILHTYVNHPPELDAHFLTVVNKMLQSGERFASFGEFLNKFKDIIGKYHFDLLAEKNKKKMISRLYQTYSQLGAA